MKKLAALIIALATAAVAACGEADTGEADAPAVTAAATSESVAPAAADLQGRAGEVYTGRGDITEVSGDKVTISHGPIEGIEWPAMTMAFAAGSPDMIRGLNVGDPVQFQFREANGDYVLTSINKDQ